VDGAASPKPENTLFPGSSTMPSTTRAMGPESRPWGLRVGDRSPPDAFNSPLSSPPTPPEGATLPDSMFSSEEVRRRGAKSPRVEEEGDGSAKARRVESVNLDLRLGAPMLGCEEPPKQSPSGRGKAWGESGGEEGALSPPPAGANGLSSVVEEFDSIVDRLACDAKQQFRRKLLYAAGCGAREEADGSARGKRGLEQGHPGENGHQLGRPGLSDCPSPPCRGWKDVQLPTLRSMRSPESLSLGRTPTRAEEVFLPHALVQASVSVE
jgi:hypothetical protein